MLYSEQRAKKLHVEFGPGDEINEETGNKHEVAACFPVALVRSIESLKSPTLRLRLKYLLNVGNTMHAH